MAEFLPACSGFLLLMATLVSSVKGGFLALDSAFGATFGSVFCSANGFSDDCPPPPVRTV